jgi:Zn-dependent metalloprotease
MKPRLLVAMAVAVTVGFGAPHLIAQGSHASQVALAHFAANARAYGLTNPSSELRERSQHDGLRGGTLVRFDQVYRGLPVFEGEAVANVDADDNVTVTNAIAGNLNVNTAARVNRNDAINTALRFISPVGDFTVRDASLWILPRGQRSILNRLVWRVSVDVENEFEAPAAWQYFIDAASGAVAFSYDALETQGRGHGGGGGGGGGGGTPTSFIGTGNTMYSGSVGLSESKLNSTYSLVDLSRPLLSGGNSTCDMGNKQGFTCTIFSSSSSTFGNGLKDNSNRGTAAADAHYGLQETWDFYASTPFNRNGIDGNGRKTTSRVHYGRNYGNAFWSDSCFCMTYGDGGGSLYPLVSLDIAGHEMSHGVMSSEANLTYSGESGGLNESNSDIFGTMVEFFANNTKDPGDYLIGEAIFTSNYDASGNLKPQNQLTAIRFMADPNKDGISPACWSSNLGSLDVHYSSGPNNHMFYLLAEGGTSKCNQNVVTGIGRATAAWIWYNAIQTMTSSSDYHDARTQALNAAAALYGATSAEHDAVAAAFSAINVN